MEVRNEYVICSTIDPQGRRLLVEVTKLLLVQHLFYDRDQGRNVSDEVTAESGWLTVIGRKVYRVSKVDPATVTPGTSAMENVAFFGVVVNWDDLETKPEALQ